MIPEVNVVENVNVTEISKNKVLTDNGDELEGTAFFAAGRTPNSEIAKDIVELNNDNTIKVDEMMKTSAENIYAAGDVIGGYQLTPVARMEGITAARNMAGYLNKISYNCIPQSLRVSCLPAYTPQCRIDGSFHLASQPLHSPSRFWNNLSVLSENAQNAVVPIPQE